MSRFASHCQVWLLLLLGLALTRPALADEPTPPPPPPPEAPAPDPAAQAKALKEQGDDAMNRLQYDRALDLYGRAYALNKDPALLYNRGRALQALTRYPEALDQLEAFQRDAPAELKALVPKLGELIADVRKHVATLRLECNVTGARVLVRQRIVGRTPLAPLRLNAGPVLVEVNADGYHPFKKAVTLIGGKVAALEVTLESKTTTGLLEVTSPVAGAVVLVDGKQLGTVPVQTALPGGSHEIVVRHSGYDEAETTAVVSVGRSSRLDVPLDQPPALTSKWWFWTGVGAVVVGGVVLTAALLTEKSPDQGDIAPGRVSGPLVRF